MNQLLDSKLTETGKEAEKDNQSTEKQEEYTLVLWDCVLIFDTEEDSLKQEETSETNVTTRSQGLLKEDNSIIPKIKKLQKKMKKIQKNTTTVKIPEFTISSQNLKKISMPIKPVEDKVDNVKKNLKEPKMGYDIVEDIKKAKANISLFEMCNVPQQKEKLLKSLEVPEKEIGEESVGGKSKYKTPAFLLTFEIFNYNLQLFSRRRSIS